MEFKFRKEYKTEWHTYRIPLVQDFQKWQQARVEQKTRLSIFDLEIASPNSLTAEAFEKIVSKSHKNFEDLSSLKYYVFENDSGDYLGNVTFSNLIPMPFSSCEIGYRVVSKHWRKGHAEKIVRFFEQVIFQEIKLHRLEAFVETDNSPSIALLKKLGFEEEGKIKQKLFRNGEWVDMFLYAKINR